MIGGIVGAIGSLGSSIIGSRTAKYNTDQTNKANRELAERQFEENKAMAEYTYSKNLEQWQRQNQYNSPQAQMQRMTEAGLNPHLMYGQGTVGNSNASPQMETAQYQAPRQGYNYKNPIDPGGMINSYLQAENAVSMNKQERFNTLKAEASAWLESAKAGNMSGQNEILNLQHKFLKETLDGRITQEALKPLIQEAEKIIKDKTAEWMKQGMSPNDSIWLRQTYQFFDQITGGQGIINMIKSLFKRTNLKPINTIQTKQSKQ